MKKLRHFCLKCYLLYSFNCTHPLITCKQILRKFSNYKDIYDFLFLILIFNQFSISIFIFNFNFHFQFQFSFSINFQFLQFQFPISISIIRSITTIQLTCLRIFTNRGATLQGMPLWSEKSMTSMQVCNTVSVV